ncbi:MAG TPA: cohesin domain-containing protein [Patescibacteria group bacterium]|nr:cohesin domain-containing protein [Patescibacteria group bacterium]
MDTQQPIVPPQMPDQNTPQPEQSTGKQKGNTPYFPPRTIVLIGLLAVFTVILLFISFWGKLSGQRVTEKLPVPTPTPNFAHSILRIMPSASASASPAEDVTIDTTTNIVNGVQFELSYDPSVVTNVIITPGPFFSHPIILFDNVDQKNGRISCALALAPQDTGVQGTGVVATISYTKFNAAQPAVFHFLPKTKVSEKGILDSVLKKTEESAY